MEAVSDATKFDVGYVFEAKNFAIGVGAYDDVLEFGGVNETSTVAHSILEGLVALFAEGTGRGLDVLLGHD